jgi:hypothetical protein
LGWRSVSVALLNSEFGLEKVDQKPYNSSIKPMESKPRPMRFLGFSDHENGAPMKIKSSLFHYPPEACGKRPAARIREVSGAL